jgi:hypothetical protein
MLRRLRAIAQISTFYGETSLVGNLARSFFVSRLKNDGLTYHEFAKDSRERIDLTDQDEVVKRRGIQERSH